MKFGAVNPDNAVGAILAHGVMIADGMFKKGRVLSRADVEAIQAAGHETVVVAQLGADDVPEDIAAYRIAVAACGAGVKPQQAFTGRANLYSSAHGLVVIDQTRVNALNHLHESLTLATLVSYMIAQDKQMVATIKVIPFAVPLKVLENALAIIGDQPLIKIAAFQKKRAGLVVTRLPQTKPSLITKSEVAIRDRLVALNSELTDISVCNHNQNDVQIAVASLHEKGCNPILVFGASAIVDRADVIPAGVVAAGGTVMHLGMPVDPGNLMMLGRIGDTDVVGVPSCARSPKENGFDWVLQRLVAGLRVTPSDIMDMGTGGLLAEIALRPTPREPKTKPRSSHRVVAIVLAAGKSTRMGLNKMLADFKGVPMVRATVSRVLQSSVDDVVVVTGHEQVGVEAALAGLNVRFIHNPYFADGLSTSLRQGLKAAAENAHAVVVCLADMPLIEPGVIDRLIAAFNPTENRTIVVPTHKGQFGNPVLWGKTHFMALMALEGDRGARAMIDQFKTDAMEIDVGTDAVLRDADTPDALAKLQN
jgi:molybdenum cofactor cytidylyltransferase